jgi:hypothetical protein
MLSENNSLQIDSFILSSPSCNETSPQIVQLLDFIANLNLLPLEISKISAEVKQLAAQISKFESGLQDNQAYWQLLGTSAQLIVNSTREDEVLEQLVPVWSQQRDHAFSREKAIDEFYREVEYYTLCCLLVQSASEQSFTSLTLAKMRAIIRRYSNMPALWYYLCQISGAELKTGYTF